MGRTSQWVQLLGLPQVFPGLGTKSHGLQVGWEGTPALGRSCCPAPSPLRTVADSAPNFLTDCLTTPFSLTVPWRGGGRGWGGRRALGLWELNQPKGRVRAWRRRAEVPRGTHTHSWGPAASLAPQFRTLGGSRRAPREAGIWSGAASAGALPGSRTCGSGGARAPGTRFTGPSPTVPTRRPRYWSPNPEGSRAACPQWVRTRTVLNSFPLAYTLLN